MPDPILDLILRRKSAKGKLDASRNYQPITMASPAFSYIGTDDEMNAKFELDDINAQISSLGLDPDYAEGKIGDLPDNTPDFLVRDVLNIENPVDLARKKAAIKWQAPIARAIDNIADPEGKQKAKEELSWVYNGIRGDEKSNYETAYNATKAAVDIIRKYNGSGDIDDMLKNLRVDSEYGLAKSMLRDPAAQKRWESLGLNPVQGIALDFKELFDDNGKEFKKQITQKVEAPDALSEQNIKKAELERYGYSILGNEIDYLLDKNTSVVKQANEYYSQNKPRLDELGKQIGNDSKLTDEMKVKLSGFQKEYNDALMGRDGEVFTSPFTFDGLKEKVESKTASSYELREYNKMAGKLNAIVNKYKGDFDTYNQTATEQNESVREYNKIVNKIQESYQQLGDYNNLGAWAEYLAKQRNTLGDRYPEYKQQELEGLVKDLAGDNVGLGEKTAFRLAQSIGGEAVDGVRKVWNNLTIWDGDKLRETEMGDAYRRRVEDVIFSYETGDQMLKDERSVIPVVPKEVQEQLNAIKNSNMSEEDRYQANYDIVSKAFDGKKIQYVANPKYGKYNITADSILNTISSVSSQFIGQMVQSYLTGGFGNVSKLRRLTTLFGTTAAQTFSREYDAAVQRGDSNPFEQAVTKSFIEGVSELPFDNIEFVKKLSPQFTRLAGDMSQAEWAALRSGKMPGNLGREFVNAVESVAKEGVLEEGLAQVGGNIADKYLFGKDKDITEGLDVAMLAGTIGFAPMSLIGLPMKYRSANMGNKLMMYQAGYKADQVINAINQQLADGGITAEEAKQRIESVKLMKEVVGKMSMYDANGKPLTDNQKAQFAWNEYTKLKAKDIEGLPEQQKQEVEQVVKEADQSSSNILNGTEDATYESQRPMQGMPAEGDLQQPQAVGQGQQEASQATQSQTNIGNSNIGSQGGVRVYTVDTIDTLPAENLDEVQTQVVTDIKSATKAVANLAIESTDKPVSVHIHDTPESYEKAVMMAGGSRQEASGSRGFYLANDGSMHFNMDKVARDTGKHEPFHIVLDYVAQKAPEKVNELFNQLQSITGGQGAASDLIARNQRLYEGDNTQKKEAITDFFARLKTGQFKVDQTNFDKVKTFVANVLDTLGFKDVATKVRNATSSLNTEGATELMSLLDMVGRKFETGESIEVKDLETYIQKAETSQTSDGVDTNIDISDMPESGRGIQFTKDVADETLRAVKTAIVSAKDLAGTKISRTLFYDNTRVGKLQIKNRLTGYTPDVDGKGGFFYSYMPEAIKNKAVLAFTSVNQAIQTLQRQLMYPDAVQAIAAQNVQTAHLGNKSTLKALFGEGDVMGIFQESVKGNKEGEQELLKVLLDSVNELAGKRNLKTGEMTPEAVLMTKVLEKAGEVNSIDEFRDKVLIGDGDSFGTRNTLFQYMLQEKPTKVTKNTRDSHNILHYKYGIPTIAEIAEGNNQSQLNNAETGDVVKMVKPYTDPVIYTTIPEIYEQYKSKPTPEMVKNGISIELLPESMNHESYPFVLRGENVGVLDNYIAATSLYEQFKDLPKKQAFYNVGRMKKDADAGTVPQEAVPQGAPAFSKIETEEILNGFYSPIVKRVNEFKQPKASATKWKEIVGMKSDEAVFSGLADWLGGMKPDQQVSKEDVLKFMKDNRIEIREVEKSDDTTRLGEIIDRKNEIEEEANKIAYQTGVFDQRAYRKYLIDSDEYYNLEKEEQELKKASSESRTKFSSYQLPGGENYKEVLITLPNRDVDQKKIEEFNTRLQKASSDESQRLDDFERDMQSKWGMGWEQFLSPQVNEADYNKWMSLTEAAGKNNNTDEYNKILEEKSQYINSVTNKFVTFVSSHFSDPNIITHLRMNTRTDSDGKKVLFLEEVQSDWGQKGKREGFAKPFVDKTLEDWLNGERSEDSVLDGLIDKYNVDTSGEYGIESKLEEILKNQKIGVSAAPYVTNTNAWVKLGLKVALKEAVKQGADRIAWTTGDQQNERYDLSKQVDEIQYNDNGDGTYSYSAVKRNTEVASKEDVDIKTIEADLGKDIADKILKSEGSKVPFADIEGVRSLKGQDLKVGGKGMKAFYGDVQNPGIVANVAKALVKELTGKEGQIVKSQIEVGKDEDALRQEMRGQEALNEFVNISTEDIPSLRSVQPAIDITPELKAAVQGGIPQFSKKEIYHNTDKEGDLTEGSAWFTSAKGYVPGRSKPKYSIPRTIDLTQFNLGNRKDFNEAGGKNNDATKQALIEKGFDGVKYTVDGDTHYWIFDVSKLDAPQFSKVGDFVKQSTGGIVDKISDLVTRMGYGYLPEDVRERLKKKQRLIDADLNEMNVLSKRLGDAVKEAYGKEYKKLDDATMTLLDNALRNFEGLTLKEKAAEAAKIPDRVLSIIEQMRANIDGMSIKLIDLDILDDMFEPVFDGEKGFGAYLTRTYRKYDDPEWVKKIPEEVRNRAIKYLKENNFVRQFDENGNELEERELTDQEVEGLINYIATNMQPVMQGLSSANLGKTKVDILKGRKEIPQEIRDLMGEYKDPMVNFAKSFAKMSSLIHTHQTLKAIADANKGTLFFDRPTGDNYVPVAGEDSNFLQPLSGLYTTPEIAEAFKKVEASLDGDDINLRLLRILAGINGIVKVGKTALSPASWVRNVIGGHIIMMKDGHLFGNGYTDGWKSAIGYFANKSKEDPAFQAKMREYIEQGILGDGVQSGEFQAIIKAAQKHDDPIEWLKSDSKLGKMVSGVKGFYSAQDDIFRVWTYENEKARLKKRKPSMTEEQLNAEASRKARAVYPTYSELPEVVRQLAKFIPISSFPAFSAELIRTTKNSVKIAIEEIRDPDMRDVGIKRLAGVISAMSFGSALAGLSSMLVGVGDDEEQAIRRYFPEWSKNSPVIWLGRDDNGLPKYIDLGFSDPFSYFKKPVVALTNDDNEMSDRIKSAVGEVAAPFVSPEIFLSALVKGTKKLKESDDLDQVMGKYAGPVYEALEPGLVASLRRIGKGMMGDVDRYGQQYDAGLELLAFFSGQRIKKMDVPVGFSFKGKEFVSAKRDIMGDYYIEKAKTDGDPEKQAEELADANEKVEKYFNELKKDYDAAMILMTRTMPAAQAKKILKNTMKDRNVPNDFIKAIEKGTEYPKIEDDK